MALTLDQVRHVAQLARLALSSEEETRYQAQLSAILDAVGTLQGVDTEGVPPTAHAHVEGPIVREDTVHASLDEAAALGNAPARSGTHFAVPKIIE